MSDFVGSPQDPAFFLHHAQAGRPWAAWQDALPALRYTCNGTRTRLQPGGRDTGGGRLHGHGLWRCRGPDHGWGDGGSDGDDTLLLCLFVNS